MVSARQWPLVFVFKYGNYTGLWKITTLLWERLLKEKTLHMNHTESPQLNLLGAISKTKNKKTASGSSVPWLNHSSCMRSENYTVVAFFKNVPKQIKNIIHLETHCIQVHVLLFKLRWLCGHCVPAHFNHGTSLQRTEECIAADPRHYLYESINSLHSPLTVCSQTANTQGQNIHVSPITGKKAFYSQLSSTFFSCPQRKPSRWVWNWRDILQCIMEMVFSWRRFFCVFDTEKIHFHQSWQNDYNPRTLCMNVLLPIVMYRYQ